MAAVLDRRLRRGSPAPLIVAFSGGGDSLALLLLAKRWADVAARRLIAVTIDHGLQADSRTWALWCAARAERLRIAHRTLAWSGDKPAAGVQARARRARHQRLAEAAREVGASVVLMGHTFDDRLEARAMRGAGGSVGEPREWAPSPVWPEGRGVFLLRPLLERRRAALRDWLRARGETWIEDPANADLASPRARSRSALGRDPLPSSPFMGEGDREAVEGASRRDLRRAVIGAAGEVDVALSEFESAAERRRLLGAALVCAGGGERPPRRAALDRLLARIEAMDEGVATLAGARVGYRVGRVRLAREAAAIARREPCGRSLPVERAIVWDGRFEIVARAPGFAVRPLAGLAGRLDRQTRARLGDIPAAARGGLPAVVAPNGRVLCPSLRRDAGVWVESLIAERLAAALGLIANEAGAETWRRKSGRTKSAWRQEGQGVQ